MTVPVDDVLLSTLGTVLQTVATAFMGIVSVFVRGIQREQRELLKSQSALQKTLEDFRGEVFRHYATVEQLNKQGDDITKLRDDFTFQMKEQRREYMDRIHKVIEEDIEPLRETVEGARRDAAVLGRDVAAINKRMEEEARERRA